MEIYKIGDFSLYLDLWPCKGCWYLSGDSADGKTYLCKLFNAAESLGGLRGNFLGMTYVKTADKSFYIKQLKDFNGKYVMLDRLDLYFDEDIISQAMSKGNRVVMIDLKNYIMCRKLPLRCADISFDSTSMRVRAI